jgi:hypothetical protein
MWIFIFFNIILSSFIGKIPFYYKDQLVYEWEQTLEEIFIYIKAPECILEKNRDIIKKNLKPGEKLPKLEVKFTSTHLTVGISGCPPYLSEELTNKVKASECLWQLDNEEIMITLFKALKADTWLAVFKGHEPVNVIQKEEIQKKMLLERFQEEHGGFDFSDAEINGNVPDPKTFMGGIKYA